MYKLNSVQSAISNDVEICKDFALDILKNNDIYFDLEKEFCKKYLKTSLNSFSFSKEGFLALLLQINKKGSIAVSLGETEALIEASKEFLSLGFKLDFLDLKNDGNVELRDIENYDFIFISSYVMDTFIKTSLQAIKEKTDAKIISNATFDFDLASDFVYFDPFKLTGYSSHGAILHNDFFEEQAIAYKDVIGVKNIYEVLKTQSFETNIKNIFKTKLETIFKDDIYFFVDNNNTLEFTLHFALKKIKARELIRTLALDEIYITNGEGCSLGLSKPSRIIQAMGYDETTSRNAISLSFDKYFDEKTCEKIVNKIYKKYKQIRILND